MKRILLKSSLLTILAFINSTLWSQTNLCGVGATLLTPGSTCTYTTANNSGFTNTPASDCTAGTEDDTGWFRFVATATSHTVTVDGATGFDAVLGVFSNCTLTTVSGGACVDNTGSDGIETRILTGLTIGTTYFIEVHHFGAGSGTNFQICITAPPTNDNCSGAIVITQQASGSCSTTTGTVGLATNSGVANCTGTADDDVWYVFNAVSTTAIIRRTTNGSWDSGIEIFNSTGAVPESCIGTSINCQDAESDFTVTGLTIGRNYYIRMYSWTSGSTPTNPDFTLCVTSPPANDNCAGAVAVPQEPNGTCTATSGTVTGATDSGIIEACFGNANDDVWFYFVATATTAIINRTAAFDSEIEVFNSTGASPGSCIGTTIDCQDGEGSLTVTGLTIGRRYYYRIYSYSSPATGTFTTCVTSNPTPPANDEPCAATALTVGATCSYTASTTAGATNILKFLLLEH